MRRSPVRFEEAWAEYKRSWAKSIAPTATPRDIDPDARRRALRAFKAGWRAAQRSAEHSIALRADPRRRGAAVSRWSVFRCQPLDECVIAEEFMGTFARYDLAIEFTKPFLGIRFRVREEPCDVRLNADGTRVLT